MEYTTVTSLRYADASETVINCMVVFPHLGSTPVPFSASENDCTDYGAEIYTRARAGDFGAISSHDLASIKANAIARINEEAESARLRYITQGDGQTMTYRQKLDEARLILLDSASVTEANGMDSATLQATYPMIWASIPSDGATPEAVATTVQTLSLAWAQIGAQIEKKRRDAVVAITGAANAADVSAAATVDWSVS